MDLLTSSMSASKAERVSVCSRNLVVEVQVTLNKLGEARFRTLVYDVYIAALNRDKGRVANLNRLATYFANDVVPALPNILVDYQFTKEEADEIVHSLWKVITAKMKVS
ncbi:MAG TPA: hypothetical protein VFI61_00940 [Patescibacteria group bacterium]|nr:hypothetical protein [Patescibacteria group bacterium]